MKIKKSFKRNLSVVDKSNILSKTKIINYKISAAIKKLFEEKGKIGIAITGRNKIGSGYHFTGNTRNRPRILVCH